MRQLYISLSKYKQYWCKLIFWGYFPPFHWICRQNFAKKMMNCLHSFFLSMQIWNMNFEKCIDVLVGKSKTQLKCRDSLLISLSIVYLCMTKVICSSMANLCLSSTHSKTKPPKKVLSPTKRNWFVIPILGELHLLLPYRTL